MKIYIDFDDVICETARYLKQIANELFGMNVPYDQIEFFNLMKSFHLNEEQYDQMMEVAHRPEKLLAYEETAGAVETINQWVDAGHDVKIITGRPFNVYEPSHLWLDQHGLNRVPLYCVDKYGRENTIKNSTFNMTLDQLYSMEFDFVIEDSPLAFEHVLHFGDCKVAVFNRPWNKQAELPNVNFVRCAGWGEINQLLKES